MDGPTLQAKIYAGYSKAALKIGQTYSLYHPISATTPLSNLISTLTAAFDSDASYNFKAPNEYGDPTWAVLVNDATTQVGDYLIGNGQTFFIAAKQFLLPVVGIDCNRIISVLRPQQETGVGAQGYGGNTPAGETILLSGWPASVLASKKSEKTGEKLPGDVAVPTWQVLLPFFSGVVLRFGDIITDDENRRYVIGSAEHTDLGWRIIATQAVT